METPGSTNNACAGLDAGDRASLAEAAAILLDARGIVIRTSEWLGGRLHAAGPHLSSEDWQARYQALVEAALRNAYRVGTLGLDGESHRRPWRRLSKLVAAATGGASGFVGLPGIAADLPITTCLMMRSIAEIARSQGENLASADTRQACIEVFAFGGPEIEDNDIDIAYWTIRGSLGHASIAMLIRQAATRFGLMLSQRYLAQTVPLIGAAAGSTLNYAFMNYYQQMARVHFTLRELERRHERGAVRDCFDCLVRRERLRRGWRRPLVARSGLRPETRQEALPPGPPAKAVAFAIQSFSTGGWGVAGTGACQCLLPPTHRSKVKGSKGDALGRSPEGSALWWGAGRSPDLQTSGRAPLARQQRNAGPYVASGRGHAWTGRSSKVCSTPVT